MYISWIVDLCFHLDAYNATEVPKNLFYQKFSLDLDFYINTAS